LYALKDCSATILFVGTEFVDQARELARQYPLKAMVYMGEGAIPEGMLSYEDLIETTEPVEDAGRKDDDLYSVFYTGGTTGDPKGVTFTHRALCQATIAYLCMLPDIEDLSFA